MFVLTANITIGSFTFKSVNEVRIKKGIHSYVDTAVIKLPTMARLKQSDETTVIVDTAKKFARGDKVTIQLGYNNKLKTEFIGFVSRVNFTTPCEIECEGYSYQIRKNNIKRTFAKGTTIRQVCEDLIKGTDITLSPRIPHMPLGSALRVTNETGAWVLDHIKDEFPYVAYFNGSQLYVGLEETEPKATVKYKLGWNTIKDGSLKFHIAEQTRARIILKTAKSDGGKDLYSTGDPDGEVREYVVGKIAKSALRDIAEGHLKQLKFTGYEGSISTFLTPYCEHGYSAQVTDDKYPERNGSYFVPCIEVTYGQSGARRVVELSKKLST